MFTMAIIPPTRTSLWLQVFLLFILLMSTDGLTVQDFYEDLDAAIIQTTNTAGDLPIEINNVIGTTETLKTFTFEAGQAMLLALILTPLYHPSFAGGPQDTSTLRFSTKPALLSRAFGDITSVYPDIDPKSATPSHLLLFNFIDIRPSTTQATMGSTLQLVIATNGMYTYAIILIVSVEQGADESDYQGRLVTQSGLVDLPYNDNLENSPYTSNSDLPGRYIIDLNEIAPPPPCPSCSDRIKSVACQILRLKSSTDGSEIPLPCRM